MKYKIVKVMLGCMTAVLLFGNMGLTSQAAQLASAVPMGGVNVGFEDGTSVVPVALPKQEEPVEKAIPNDDADIYENIVIAQVSKYVNIRSLPSEEGEILGKLYNKSAGKLLGEENGWYLIKSGSVTGYVKAEYCVTGQAAVDLAKEVGTRIAKVETTTLRVRQEPSAESATLGLIPIDDELLVLEEVDGWVKVDTQEGDGYISAEYVSLKTEFVQAESKEEEEARLAKEEAERKAAKEAAQKKAAEKAAMQAAQQAEAKQAAENAGVTVPSTGSGDLGAQVAEYALQFLGYPYKHGGSSLTNGTDCSGFTMRVYENFGIALPRSSGDYRSVGYAVDGLANAQPGDIIVYSGHVAIYIGNNQIVHASNKKDGIKISQADYKKHLSIRRIF